MSLINRRDDFVDKLKYRKLEYLSLPSGSTSVIRLLQDEAKDFFYHYINRYTVKCLEEDCPICANNQELIYAYPEDFRNQPGFIPRRLRHVVNVYDKTIAKLCPSCGIDVKDTTLQFCPKCKHSLLDVEAKPINRVKVLAKGPQVFNPLDDMSKVITDADGNLLGITNFDVNLIVRGAGKNTTTTVVSNPASSAPVVLNEEDELFDLDDAIITLTASEMLELVSGISLRDVFVARSVDKDTREKVTTIRNPVQPVDVLPNLDVDVDVVSMKVSELFK